MYRAGALLGVVFVVVCATAAFDVLSARPRIVMPINFEECAAQYPVQGTFPRTCTVPFGKTFVEYDGNVPQVNNEIQLTSLPPAPLVTSSPFTFSGQAEPSWLAGSGLVAELMAGTGDVIGTATAVPQPPSVPSAAGFTAFTVSISFTEPANGTEGALVLKKPGSNTELIIPIVY
jgi:hypothetical protein